jgi:hypothetical protein
MVKPQTLTAEAAGVGFAAAAALAEQFRGQETASIVALNAAGIHIDMDDVGSGPEIAPEQFEIILANLRAVYKTLDEHVRSWKDFNMFQHQWLLKTFQKDAGMNSEQWLQALRRLEEQALAGNSTAIAAANLPAAEPGEVLCRFIRPREGFCQRPGRAGKAVGNCKRLARGSRTANGFTSIRQHYVWELNWKNNLSGRMKSMSAPLKRISKTAGNRPDSFRPFKKPRPGMLLTWALTIKICSRRTGYGSSPGSKFSFTLSPPCAKPLM